MPIPLSLDLRKRVIAAIESGMNRDVAAKTYQVTKSVISKWCSLKAKTGSLAPKKGYQKGHSNKIVDLKEFKAFVLTNKNDSLEVLAKKYGSVSDTTVGRAMKKIGFTKKKDFWVQGAD